MALSLFPLLSSVAFINFPAAANISSSSSSSSCGFFHTTTSFPFFESIKNVAKLQHYQLPAFVGFWPLTGRSAAGTIFAVVFWIFQKEGNDDEDEEPKMSAWVKCLSLIIEFHPHNHGWSVRPSFPNKWAFGCYRPFKEMFQFLISLKIVQATQKRNVLETSKR